MLLSLFKVYGHSMEPTIRNGSMVLCSGIPYLFSKPKVGDIALFSNKKKKAFVKRIQRIEGGRYVCMGDNKVDSLDSKSFGPIVRRNIIGKVVVILGR